MSAIPTWRFRDRMLVDALGAAARGMYILAIVLAMNVPRIELAGVHLTASDATALLGAACWLLRLAVAPGERIALRAGLWPSLAVVAGMVSLAATSDWRHSAVGIVELAVIWVLHAVAVPSLFDTRRAVEQLLVAASVGGAIAAVVNIATAVMIGFDGGIPQVWGPAQYLQGYYQVIGLAVAVPRMLRALQVRDSATIPWSIAVVLHFSALVITQTRGAWIAGLAALLLVAMLAGRRSLIVALAAIAAVAVLVATADWAAILRARVQSIFSLEAGRIGFDSSIIRLTLAFIALRMFADHPLTGVGLKNFVPQLAAYSPAGLPEAVEMGPQGVVTAIEGPHSTYLSLLAETGILGFIAICGWLLGAGWHLVRAYRRVSGYERLQVISLAGAVTVVAIFNCFLEMNSTGTLPFVALLAVAYRMPALRSESV